MRTKYVWLVMLAGCGGAPVVEQSTPDIAAIELDAGVPDAAAPTPADAEIVDLWSEPIGLDEVDTTVTIDELRAVTGWAKAEKVKHGGDVMLALHVEPDNLLHLSVVEDNTGIVHSYPLGPADMYINNHTFDGNTFPARGVIGEYVGPIVFAVRVEGRQVAVWAEDGVLYAAEKVTDWQPLVRVKFPKRTTFEGIGTTYPH